MKYYKLSSSKAQEMLGKYSHLSKNGQELVIVTPGTNRGEKGVPNLDFILPFPGVPLTKDGRVYNIRQGFRILELAEDYYRGFDESTFIVPLAKIRSHPTNSKKKQALVTFDPSKVEFVLIGRRCNQDTDQLTRKELRELATFASMGEPKGTSEVYWDYYALPFHADYNYAIDKDKEKFLSDARYVAMGGQAEKRRQMLRKALEDAFGSLDNMTCMSAVKVGERRKETKPSVAKDGLCEWCYFDGFYRTEVWVINEDGRCLAAKNASHGTSDPKYVGAEISLDRQWKQVSENCLVVRYERKSFSEPTTYEFLQRPTNLTAAQRDRLRIIEENMHGEVREIVNKYDLFDRLALRGEEASWTLQLHDEEVIAQAE